MGRGNMYCQGVALEVASSKQPATHPTGSKFSW